MTLSWSRLKPSTTIILSFGKQTPQEGLVGLLSCAAAGVFVHCWSSLLSPICCYSLAWKQDQECFHTYAHWPLINKSDRGPFPHIHTTQMNTKSIHTETRSLTTETSQSSLTRSPPHLSSQWIRPGSPYFCLSKPTAFSDVSIVAAFFFCFGIIIIFIDGCSPEAASPNTRRLVLISCSLFILVGMNRQVLLCGFVI